MDARVWMIFNDEMSGDTSFLDDGGGLLVKMLGGVKYNSSDMRNTWHSGVRHGIEIGLRRASVDIQRFELYHSIKDPKQKEFLDKFYALAAEYDCAIQYHPKEGMMVGSLK